jgi:beta-galactosidase/beta-glucuronidase
MPLPLPFPLATTTSIINPMSSPHHDGCHSSIKTAIWPCASVLHFIHDPSVFGVNKLAPRAIVPRPDCSLVLDGEWQFQCGVLDSMVAPDSLLYNDQDSHQRSTWSSITVPSNWQMHAAAKSIPRYSNIKHPFVPADPPSIPTNINEVAFYKRSFSIPRDWHQATHDGQRVIIRFDGVRSCFFVWINGKLVGYSQDSCTEAEFDITDHLIAPATSGSGTAPDQVHQLVSVQVFRWCDGSYLEDQDCWRLSGIYRTVHVYRTPSVCMLDCSVRAWLDASGSGSIDVAISVGAISSLLQALHQEPELMPASCNPLPALFASSSQQQHTGDLAEYSISATLWHGDDVVHCWKQCLASHDLGPRGKSDVHLSANELTVMPWSCEQPVLYRVVLALERNGVTVDSTTVNTGFRYATMH